MRFSEAIGLLVQGKKMRSLAWTEDSYISLLYGDIIDENGNSYNFVEDDVIDGWEEYIEPETKKIEKLDIRDDTHIALLNPQNNEGAIMTHINELRSENHKMAKKINELIKRMNELCGEK